MISGTGLASAMIKGCAAMLANISGLSAPAADKPRKMSAPPKTSANVVALDVWQNLFRVHLRTSWRLWVNRPSLSATHMFCCWAPSESNTLRQAIAAAPAPETHDLHLRDALACLFQAVQNRRPHDDRRPVLIVVKYGDVHAGAQGLFDLEAVGCANVLEVDAPERRFQGYDHLDELFRIDLIDLDVEDVQAGELLEQHRLTLHDRLAGERPDVAKA